MFRELLKREFSPYGGLSDWQLGALEAHYSLLRHWNARMNLTRIESVEDSVRFHYCESLFLGARLPEGKFMIADIGSGPGFPGIPVAVLRPECMVTLVESNQRKAVFLREAARDIPNLTVVAKRANEVTTTFDWVVARAVHPREVLGLHAAPRAALLLGRGDEVALAADFSEAVPWGRDRILAMFHVKP